MLFVFTFNLPWFIIIIPILRIRRDSGRLFNESLKGEEDQFWMRV